MLLYISFTFIYICLLHILFMYISHTDTFTFMHHKHICPFIPFVHTFSIHTYHTYAYSHFHSCSNDLILNAPYMYHISKLRTRIMGHLLSSYVNICYFTISEQGALRPDNLFPWSTRRS